MCVCVCVYVCVCGVCACLPACLSVWLSVCLSVCLCVSFVCLFYLPDVFTLCCCDIALNCVSSQPAFIKQNAEHVSRVRANQNKAEFMCVRYRGHVSRLKPLKENKWDHVSEAPASREYLGVNQNNSEHKCVRYQGHVSRLDPIKENKWAHVFKVSGSREQARANRSLARSLAVDSCRNCVKTKSHSLRLP